MSGAGPVELDSLRLSTAAAELARAQFGAAARVFRERGGDLSQARAWFVPGRVELLGKHTDYGGGRSLLAAVERGFHVVAAPRADGLVRFIDGGSGSALNLPIAPDLPARPSHWSDYPITVIRRLARDFPEAGVGMDAVFTSSLPSASGLSSSGALVIAALLPLAEFNELREAPAWRATLADGDALAGYLGAMENGQAFGGWPADRGVGTHGGSEDHTAILRCRQGALSQYRFLPVAHELTVPLPAGWTIAIGVSGVHASKGGTAQAAYNRLSRELRLLLSEWNDLTGRKDVSLLTAMESSPDAAEQLKASIPSNVTERDAMVARLDQFIIESMELIPLVTEKLSIGDVEGIGPLIARSHALAVDVLKNQVPETIHLAESARAHGAAASSAFGAGFGGSVWALVRVESGEEFLGAWRSDYLRKHPARASRAGFFLTQAGPGAAEIRLPAISY